MALFGSGSVRLRCSRLLLREPALTPAFPGLPAPADVYLHLPDALWGIAAVDGHSPAWRRLGLVSGDKLLSRAVRGDAPPTHRRCSFSETKGGYMNRPSGESRKAVAPEPYERNDSAADSPVCSFGIYLCPRTKKAVPCGTAKSL